MEIKNEAVGDDVVENAAKKKDIWSRNNESHFKDSSEEKLLKI